MTVSPVGLRASGGGGSRRVSAGCGECGHPGSAGQRVAQRGDLVEAVFRGGGDVAEDGVAIFGSRAAGQSAGDLLLNLGRPQVAFGLVRGGRDLEVAPRPFRPTPTPLLVRRRWLARI